MPMFLVITGWACTVEQIQQNKKMLQTMGFKIAAVNIVPDLAAADTLSEVGWYLDDTFGA